MASDTPFLFSADTKVIILSDIFVWEKQYLINTYKKMINKIVLIMRHGESNNPKCFYP